MQRLISCDNDLGCWDRTNFVKVDSCQQQIHFNIYERSLSSRRIGNPCELKKVRVGALGTTLRSTSDNVFKHRLLCEPQKGRALINAVVDQLVTITNFGAFKGFKGKGERGEFVEVAKKRKRKSLPLEAPRPRKASLEERTAAGNFIAARAIANFRPRHVGIMRTLLDDDVRLREQATSLLRFLVDPWRLVVELPKLCVELQQGAVPPLAVADVSVTQKSRVLQHAWFVGKALEFCCEGVGWYEACDLTVKDFTSPLGSLPPAASTIALWGCEFVKQGCLFRVSLSHRPLSNFVSL